MRLDSMDLGARRMDLIGLKFQLTDEIATSYAKAYALQNSKRQATAAPRWAATWWTSTR